jgi:hypothetical protein
VKPAIIAAALVLTLTACAAQQQQRFANHANTYIGQPESVLISRLGLPQAHYTADDGTKYLQWHWGTTHPGFAYTTFVGRSAVSMPVGGGFRGCQFTVRRVDRAVAAWHAQGNNCELKPL